MADSPKMQISVTDRGIMAGEKLVGGILSIFVAKQSAGDIASALGDIARIGVYSAGSQDLNADSGKLPLSGKTFVFTGK